MEIFDFTLFEFISAKTLYVILHLVGLAFGVGGAYISDAMFFNIMRDKMISVEEHGFFKILHRIITFGLILLIVSGALLFVLNPDRYLDSSKFLAKVTIVAIIAVNGLLLHYVHMPVLTRMVNQALPENLEFREKSKLLYASGAVSVVSWTAALILGVFRGIPYTYWQIMGVYLLVVFVAIGAAMLMREKHISNRN